MAMKLDRISALRVIVAYQLPIDGALADLASYGLDSDAELVTVTAADVRGILQRYLAGALSEDDLTRWAEIIEGRDDIALDPVHQEALGMVVFTLANPDINTQMRPEAAKALIEWLGAL
jgi:hypothetical protein